MRLSVSPVLERGRQYAFPIVWTAVLATGVGLQRPLPDIDSSLLLSFNVVAPAAAEPVLDGRRRSIPSPQLTFVRHDIEPDEVMTSSPRDIAGSHGRFAAPANAVRRKVQVRAINPRTADELAGFFRDVSYTLTDVRQGEAVPPIKVERVPDDLAAKDGSVRKALFITALLPVILEVNHRVLVEREQLLLLRDKGAGPAGISPLERSWLEQLADRYDTSADKLDELVRRVDIVPPSMAIAQSGIEFGLGHLVCRPHRERPVRSDPVGRTPRRRRAVEAGSGHAAALHQCRRSGGGLCLQPQYARRLQRFPPGARDDARARRDARRLSADRQAAALFGARPAICRLRAPGDARGPAHRLRQGTAVQLLRVISALLVVLCAS